jgi:hypothetical protein
VRDLSESQSAFHLPTSSRDSSPLAPLGIRNDIKIMKLFKFLTLGSVADFHGVIPEGHRFPALSHLKGIPYGNDIMGRLSYYVRKF